MGGEIMIRLKSVKKPQPKVVKKVIEFLEIYDVIEQTRMVNLFELVYIDEKIYTIEEISIKLSYCSRTIQRYILIISKIIFEVQRKC